MEIKKINFNKINSFDFKINYAELNSESLLNNNEFHTHNECEIYINTDGNVSFAVENSIYPIVRGNIVITRPNERHHCIYHTNDTHRYFWILFSPNGNEWLFDIFFNRDLGNDNLLQLNIEDTEKLIEICKKLCENVSNAEKYYLFFRLIDLLNHSEINRKMSSMIKKTYLAKALNYINNDITISVNDLAKKCHISVNTLERDFKKHFGVSPSVYIRKQRLANAIKLIDSGYSITNAAEISGFSDCSNFISVFKKYYNITPFQYKKRLKNRLYVNSWGKS